MSVLIKDMEKPKSCYAVIDGEYEYCPFVNTDDDCVLLLEKGICEGTWEMQYSKCPLVETPEPCEDAISIDWITEYMNNLLIVPTGGGVLSGFSKLDKMEGEQEMMTLDDAISYYDEVAEKCRRKANIERNDYMDLKDNASEAKQLADWLNELKLFRDRIEIQHEPCDDATRGCTYKPDCPWYDGVKCNSPNDQAHNECDYDRGIFPESYNYDPRADIYYLAEKIGIHRLYTLVVELRGEPEPCEDAVSRKDVIDLYKRGAEIIAKAKGIRVEDMPHNGLDALMNLPSVTPKRKKGKWLDNYQYGYKCSECGAYLEIDCGDVEMNFCPNCNADMRGKQDEFDKQTD